MMMMMMMIAILSYKFQFHLANSFSIAPGRPYTFHWRSFLWNVRTDLCITVACLFGGCFRNWRSGTKNWFNSTAMSTVLLYVIVASCLWHTCRNCLKSCFLFHGRSPVLWGLYFWRRFTQPAASNMPVLQCLQLCV